jgi:chromosome segregation and condensation protein ScpB
VPPDVEAVPTGEAMEELLRLVEALVFASSVPVLPRALTQVLPANVDA